MFLAGTFLALVGVFVLANDAADTERKRSASADGPAVRGLRAESLSEGPGTDGIRISVNGDLQGKDLV